MGPHWHTPTPAHAHTQSYLAFRPCKRGDDALGHARPDEQLLRVVEVWHRQARCRFSSFAELHSATASA